MIKPASCARSLFIAVASLLLVQCDNSSSGGAPTSPGSGEAVDLALVQRDQHVAVSRQSFAQREAQGTRHQRLRPVDHEVVMIEPLLVTLFENVAESFGRDEGRPGALALDQRIGGERCSVDEDAHVGRSQPGLIEHQPDALDHAKFRRRRGGEDLAAPALGAGFEHDIGEGAADVGGELDLLCHGCDYGGVLQICKFLSLLQEIGGRG